MAEQREPPIVFLAFANEQDHRVERKYLRALAREVVRTREALDRAVEQGWCELVVWPNATLHHVFDVFRKYDDRIAVFHFGGHADSYRLLFEGDAGTTAEADAAGFARFLAAQAGLRLVFLNACSTAGQVGALQEAKVPVVIATSQEIPDDVATEFSAQFYKSLAAGRTLSRAFEEATGATRAGPGGEARHLQPAEDAPAGVAADQPLWSLETLPGAEDAADWSLPTAAGDPLFGLPSLPEGRLPAEPYRRLGWFRREDAEIFFGRGKEIAELYRRLTASNAEPILLFYGQSGVGKSSILEAGLLPRLDQVHAVTYRRRDKSRGLSSTLADTFGIPDGGGLRAAWCGKEKCAEKPRPLTVILDQVEEVFTRPNQAVPNEMAEFMTALRGIFADRECRPQGKLILSFRKEWLAELEKGLHEEGLPYSWVFLERLSRDGVIEAIKGPTRTSRLRDHFGSTIESGLPELIADDLLADRASPVAPMLQILLAGMWDVAKKGDGDYQGNYDHPRFDEPLYDKFREQGLKLDDFLRGRLEELYATHAPAVESGLALDVLAYYTTPLGTADQRTMADLEKVYHHVADILPGLVQACRELYLLVDPKESKPGEPPASRLAHDTLAPHVRQMFQESDRPGQRALRAVENRAAEWKDGKVGAPLDDTDLALVEAGQSGTRAWRPDEVRMVEASQEERDRRRLAVALREQAAQVRTLLPIRPVEALALAVSGMGRNLKSLPNELVGSVQTSLHAALRVARERTVMSGHTAAVTAVAFRPDGQAILSAAGDRMLRLWDCDGQPLGEPIAGHEDYVAAVAFSRDAEMMIASGGEDHTLRLWDQWGNRVAVCAAGTAVTAVAWNPDGSRVVTGGADRTLRLWERDGRPLDTVMVGHTDYVTAVAWSPDGTRIVSASADRTLRLWDAGGRPLGDAVVAHEDDVTAVAWSPDGTRIASASPDRTLRLWDREGKPQSRPFMGHTKAVTAVAFTSVDGWIVSGSEDGTIRLWDQRGREVDELLIGHTDQITALAVSPDGTRIASGGIDRTVRLWDRTGHAPSQLLTGHTSDVNGIVLPGGGATIVTGSADQSLRLWNWEGRQVSPPVLRAHDGFVLHVALNPDGKGIASGGADGKVRLWDERLRPAADPFVGHEGAVNAVVFSPDGQSILSGSADRTVRRWRLDGSRVGEPWRGHRGEVKSIVVTPDGQTVLTSGLDWTIRRWDADGQQVGDPLVGGPDHRPVRIALDRSGTVLASAGADGSVYLWDLGNRRGVPLHGHQAGVYAVAFSPDGRVIASGGEDRTVRLWDVNGQAISEPLRGHSAAIGTLVFDVTGSILVSGDAVGQVRVWRQCTWQSWLDAACGRLAGHPWMRSDLEVAQAAAATCRQRGLAL